MTITCRLSEIFSLVEVFARGDYLIPKLDWASVRTVADVGANIGAATLWFAERAPNAKIIAIEPSTQACRLLRKNVENNGLSGRVIVHQVAVASVPGTAHLTAGRSTVNGSTVGVGQTGAGENIDAISFGDILQLADGAIDVLKLDCEGAEYGLLASVTPEALSSVKFIVGEAHVMADVGVPGQLQAQLANSGFDYATRLTGPEAHVFSAVRRSEKGANG